MLTIITSHGEKVLGAGKYGHFCSLFTPFFWSANRGSAPLQCKRQSIRPGKHWEGAPLVWWEPDSRLLTLTGFPIPPRSFPHQTPSHHPQRKNCVIFPLERLSLKNAVIHHCPAARNENWAEQQPLPQTPSHHLQRKVFASFFLCKMLPALGH